MFQDRGVRKKSELARVSLIDLDGRFAPALQLIWEDSVYEAVAEYAAGVTLLA